MDETRRAVIMRPNRLHICVFLLLVTSGVWCKEKAAEVDIPDYQDSTVPPEFELKVDHSLKVFRQDSIMGPRASGAESSTTRTETGEVEASTTEAPGHAGDKQGVRGQVNVSAKKRKSTVIDPVSVKLLRGENNGIIVTDVALTKPILYFNYSQAKTYSVDYHYAKKFVFFTALDKIFRDEFVGRLLRVGQRKAIVDVGTECRVSLAVDWVHDRLYWMSDRHQTVEAADLNGSNRTLLIDNLSIIRFPNNIAVDPYAGHLFLVSSYSVFRADLDGANLTRLELEGEDTREVKCLALDTSRRRVYYSGKEGHPETGAPYIASCDYEGGSCQDHSLPYKWNNIFSLDVLQDTLYFAHYIMLTDTLYSVDLTKPKLSPVRLQAAEPSSLGIRSIRVFHPGVQRNPKEKNFLGGIKNQIQGGTYEIQTKPHSTEKTPLTQTVADTTETSTPTDLSPLHENDNYENKTFTATAQMTNASTSLKGTPETTDSSTSNATLPSPPPPPPPPPPPLPQLLESDGNENKNLTVPVTGYDYDNKTGILLVETTDTVEDNVERNPISDNTLNGSFQEYYRPAFSPSVQVFMGQNGLIGALDITRRRRLENILKSERVNFYSIDFLYNDSLIFYTAYDRIISATIDTDHFLSDSKVIVDEEVDGNVRLAVDWINKKLYWMADKNQTIMMADLDGKNRTRLFDKVSMNFIYPNNIVVDPYESTLFFVNNHVVYKSDLNGINTEILPLPENYEGIEGRGVKTIALDRKNKQLYFTGKEQDGFENPYYLNKINYIDVNYSDIQEFNMSGLNDIYGMDILGDTLYFAHFNDKGLKESGRCSDLLSVSTNFSRTDTPEIRLIATPMDCKNGIWSIKVFHQCAQTLLCDVPRNPRNLCCPFAFD